MNAITINAAPALTVTTTGLPNGIVGTAYSQPLTATGGTGGYVQFLVDDAERVLYAETVSNEYLLPARALTPAEEMALLDLGWLPPSRSRDIDVPGSPNFNRLFEYPVPVGEFAVLALKTLRLLHGDIRPGGLDVTFFRRKQKAPYGARGAREP